ncbi:MAG: hypothetical protein M3540_01000, partial [Actinomycetota bacterium]|nr:hypothetical protein [Actinomycetota bacterium]
GPSRASLVAGLKELTGIVDKLPDDLKTSLTPKLKEIGALFAKMVTPDDRRKVLAQIKALRKEAADEIGRFADDAWSRVRDAVLNAFDQRYTGRIAGNREFAGTRLGRAQAAKRGDIAGGQIAAAEAGGLTPAMQTIKTRGQAVLDAWDQVRGAIVMGGGQGGLGQIEGAVDALAEAQSQFDGIGGELTDAEQAYLTAWQTMIESANTLGEAALDDYQKDAENRARIARKSLEPKLNKVYADLRAGKITLQQAQTAISELLAPFGLSLADLGDTLDTSELTDALGALTAAIESLTGLLTSGGGGAAGPDPRALPVPGRPGGVQGVDAFQVYPSQLVAAGGGQAGPQLEAVVNLTVNGRVELDGQQVGVLTFEPIRNEAVRFKRRTGLDAFTV